MIRNLKRGLLFFWGIWFLAVSCTNFLDGLLTWGLIDADWKAVSGNYLLVSKTTAIYRVPSWINNFLFFSLTAWHMVCALLFFKAFALFSRRAQINWDEIYKPFCAGIALFAGFLIACEIFIAYEFGAIHFGIIVAQLASLLAIRLIPETVSP